MSVLKWLDWSKVPSSWSVSGVLNSNRTVNVERKIKSKDNHKNIFFVYLNSF